jgi:hypothetical protein
MADRIAHVDVGNQIDNSWNKDSALAIKMDKVGFSIKIREQHKKKIKKRFIINSNDKKVKRKNRRVAVILHSYLLFRLLKEYQEICDVVKVCGDMGSFAYLNKYYSKICKYYQTKINLKIKPRKGDKKSKAHHLANDVYNRKKKEDILIKTANMDEIIKVIETLLQ